MCRPTALNDKFKALKLKLSNIGLRKQTSHEFKLREAAKEVWKGVEDCYSLRRAAKGCGKVWKTVIACDELRKAVVWKGVESGEKGWKDVESCGKVWKAAKWCGKVWKVWKGVERCGKVRKGVEK